MKRLFLAFLLLFPLFAFAENGMGPGPGTPHAVLGYPGITVSSANTRYFQTATGTLVYLTGSHDWDNVQDQGATDPPTAFDWSAFLSTAQTYSFTFVRLWSQQQPKFQCGTDPVSYTDPMPWNRVSGSGNADDGKLKFDLTSYNSAYFSRLRSRVIDLNSRGIVAGVMLFEGYGPQYCGLSNDGFPFRSGNNVNSVGLSTEHSAETTTDSTVVNLEKAYVAHTIDALNDLNVIWEVANEAGSDSVTWQGVIKDYIRSYEAGKPNQHPVWFSFPHPDSDNTNVWASDANTVSPGQYESYDTTPPVNSKGKPVILDTDHLGGTKTAEWYWRSFLRGFNPIWMHPTNDASCDATCVSVSTAMKIISITAKRIGLVNMAPSSTTCSTGYCLDNAGVEHLAYLSSAGSVTVDLTANSKVYSVGWIDTTTGALTSAGSFTGGSSHLFSAPTGSLAIDDSYSVSNSDDYNPISAAYRRDRAQSFTSQGGLLDSAKAYLCSSGSPTGNITMELYNHQGVYGTSSIPADGPPIATSDAVDASTLPACDSYSLVTFTFSGANRVTLTAGTHYVVSTSYQTGDAINYVRAGADSSSPSHSGNPSHWDGSVWTADTDYDDIFYVYTLTNGTQKLLWLH